MICQCHPNQSVTVPPKRLQGALRIFLQNVAWLSLFWKNVFPFSCVELCGYDNSPNDGTIKFLAKFGPISHLLKNRGTRQRIQSQDIKITRYLQLFITYKWGNIHTPVTSLYPGLPRWAGTRKVKSIWILLKQETVSGSDISWAICKSAPRSRQIAMPAPHHSVFYRPDALPATQPTMSKQGGNRDKYKSFGIVYTKQTDKQLTPSIKSYSHSQQLTIISDMWYLLGLSSAWFVGEQPVAFSKRWDSGIVVRQHDNVAVLHGLHIAIVNVLHLRLDRPTTTTRQRDLCSVSVNLPPAAVNSFVLGFLPWNYH